jgi:hypothetical protein
VAVSGRGQRLSFEIERDEIFKPKVIVGMKKLFPGGFFLKQFDLEIVAWMKPERWGLNRESTHSAALRADGWTLPLPFWAVVLALAFLPGWRIQLRLRLFRRRRQGACPVCGYDLRASPGRCPECGCQSSPSG